MKWSGSISLTLATVAALFGVPGTPNARAQEKKPNILVIMGDDVDWFNVGASHRADRPRYSDMFLSWKQLRCQTKMLEPCHRNKH
jgi:hypothetical protein